MSEETEWIVTSNYASNLIICYYMSLQIRCFGYLCFSFQGKWSLGNQITCPETSWPLTGAAGSWSHVFCCRPHPLSFVHCVCSPGTKRRTYIWYFPPAPPVHAYFWPWLFSPLYRSSHFTNIQTWLKLTFVEILHPLRK